MSPERQDHSDEPSEHDWGTLKLPFATGRWGSRGLISGSAVVPPAPAMTRHAVSTISCPRAVAH